MPADLQPVIDEITATNTVLDGAIVYVGSVPGLLKKAADDAIANGATADQLKPVTDLAATLKSKGDALAAAIAANTPSPPPTPAQLAKLKS